MSEKRGRVEFLLGRSPLKALLDTLEESAISHELDREPLSGQLTLLLIAPMPCISKDNDFSSCKVLKED